MLDDNHIGFWFAATVMNVFALIGVGVVTAYSIKNKDPAPALEAWCGYAVSVALFFCIHSCYSYINDYTIGDHTPSLFTPNKDVETGGHAKRIVDEATSLLPSQPISAKGQIG